MNQGYQSGHSAYGHAGVQSAVDSRAKFIVRTYNHLFGAILLFAGLEVFYFMTGISNLIMAMLVSVPWLVVLGVFMVGSWLASRFAHNVGNQALQYVGLAGLVFLYSIIFVMPLYIADNFAPGAIQSAGITTILGFAGLTAIAFVTRKDFSFLRGILMWAGILALVAIVASFIFGFQLGTYFAVGMVGFAGAAILYDTSNVIHHFPEDRYVGAATELFASVAMAFWYLLMLFSSRD